MEKLMGCLFIIAGCAGCIFCWRETERKKQVFMEEIIRMLSGWQYALEKEQMHLYDFLSGYDTNHTQMKKLLLELKKKLQSNSYVSGQCAWKELLEEQKGQLPLKGGKYRLLMEAGDSFFAGSSVEIIRCCKVCTERMEEELKAERAEFLKKQKVYVPVGMLGGLMLVILLV